MMIDDIQPLHHKSIRKQMHVTLKITYTPINLNELKRVARNLNVSMLSQLYQLVRSTAVKSAHKTPRWSLLTISLQLSSVATRVIRVTLQLNKALVTAGLLNEISNELFQHDSLLQGLDAKTFGEWLNYETYFRLRQTKKV